jgi:hypothetical protein
MLKGVELYVRSISNINKIKLLLLIRLFANKNNIKIKDNQNKSILFCSVLVVNIIPIINIFFTISSV